MSGAGVLKNFEIAIDKALDEAYIKGLRSGNAALTAAHNELNRLRAIQADPAVFTFDGTCVAHGTEITVKRVGLEAPEKFVLGDRGWWPKEKHVHTPACYPTYLWQMQQSNAAAQCNAQFNQGQVPICGK